MEKSQHTDFNKDRQCGLQQRTAVKAGHSKKWKKTRLDAFEKKD